MRILATMPGRYGDILWAAATMRAISEAYGAPIDVGLSEKYAGIGPLLEAQPYVQAAGPIPTWDVQETAPMTPRIPPTWEIPPGYYDAVYHLGYEGWPQGTLAEDIAQRARRQYEQQHPTEHFLGKHPRLDLARPWIDEGGHPAPPAGDSAAPKVYLGWSEEWFELKVGLSVMLAKRFPAVDFWWVRPWGGRYDEIDQSGKGWPDNFGICRANWLTAAGLMFWADVYVGCLSSAWVLANATGTPAVVCEPNAQRHHPVFWQDGKGKNVLVRGIDGQPTFDARHVGDALEVMLAKVATVKEYVRTRERMELGEGE